MSLAQCRTDLFDFVVTNWPVAFPAVPMFYENGPTPNLAAQSTPFATLELDILDSMQAELSNSRTNRFYGALYLTVFVPDGIGTAPLIEAFDWLVDNMVCKQIGLATCQSLSPRRPPIIPGWYAKTVQLPFYYHR